MRWSLVLCCMIYGTSLIPSWAQTNEKLFQQMSGERWNLVFTDPGQGDWQEKWFLDGLRGTVKNTVEGMFFSAGPVFGDNGSHNVLWTKQSFQGDIRIEFDYTRLDDIQKAVNILYIQATGVGQGPYTEDISQWSDLRIIPYMNRYFLNMKLLHISYAAFPLNQEDAEDYVRARVYPVPEGGNFGKDTQLPPDNFNTGLFKPGVTYHFTVIKKGHHLFFQVRENGETDGTLFYWDTSSFQEINQGRIGIRHMYTRAARYANFKVFQLK